MDVEEFKKLAMVAGGNALTCRNHIIQPSESPVVLSYREPSVDELPLVNSLAAMIESGPILAIMLVDKGQIVYEQYKKPATESCPLFSWSMSKSLVAYTLNYLDIDVLLPAKTYAPQLENTVYGEARVKDLLTMSSGVRQSISHGNQKIGEWWDMKTQVMSTIEHLHQCSKKSVKPGSRFNYSGTDTEAICHLIDENGGFLNYFTDKIWNASHCEHKGYWMLEKDDRVIAQAGFSASARDWIRLCIHLMNELKNSKYLQDATSPQIPNNSYINTSFKWYGYQTWIGNNSFWLAGMDGQRIGIDPIQEKILLVSSFKGFFVHELYRIFNKFQNL